MKCPNCGKELANNSKFCAECGAKLRAPNVPPNNVTPQPVRNETQHKAKQAPVSASKTPTTSKKKNMGCLIGFVVVLFVILTVLIIAVNSGKNSSNNDTNSTDSSNVINTRPDNSQIIDINYLELYNNNSEYEGKYVRIVGKISSIDKNVTNIEYITFDDGLSGITQTVYLNMEKSGNSIIGKYNEGDYVVAVGKVGKMFSKTLNIDDCYIETSGDEAKSLFEKSINTVSAIDLLKDYEANEVNADNQYKSKILRISGTIDSIGKDIADTAYITLQSDNKYSIFKVQCYFKDEKEIAKVATLQAGQSIEIIGICNGKIGNISIEDCSIV